MGVCEGGLARGGGFTCPGSGDEETGCTLAEEEGGRQPGLSHGQMAAQLHDLRKVEAAKKEFEEYVRQQVSPWGLASRAHIGEETPGSPS